MTQLEALPRNAPSGRVASPASHNARNQLDTAVERGDWERASRVLHWVDSRLRIQPPAIDSGELRDLLTATRAAAQKAEKENQWSFLDILLAILTLGIPALVDALSEADHERLKKEARELEQRLRSKAPKVADRVEHAPRQPIAPASAAPGATALSPVFAGVRIRRPQAALEGRNFDRLIARMGLTQAVADGVITAFEARELGIAGSVLLQQAARSGDAQAIDGYVELAGITSARSAVHPLAASELLNPANAADYIVLAPRALHDALTPLLNHRASGGHRIALVDPRDVFKLYGKSGPQVLARFLHEARRQWSEPQPRYVLLVGDGAGEGPTVPTFQLSSRKQGHGWMLGSTFASDNPFGDVDHRGVPQLAVGRLPVDSAEELETTVAKIIAYEAVRPAGLWQTRALIIDGDPMWGHFIDAAVDWYARQEMHQVPGEYDVERASFNRGGSDEGAADEGRVRQRIDDGVLLVSYVGHGLSQWTDGITVQNAALMHPKGGEPVVALTACLTGEFANEGKVDANGVRAGDSLAEELVEGNGPALAAIGASEVSIPHNNAAWARILSEEMLRGDATTMGDIVTRTKSRLADNDVDGLPGFAQALVDSFLWLGSLFGLSTETRRAHLYMYNLMGDPATELRRPVQVDVGTPAQLTPGHRIPLRLELPPGTRNGVAFVAIERPVGENTAAFEDPEAKGISDQEAIARRQRNAVRARERRVLMVAIPVVAGELEGDLILPPGITRGRYNLRVAVVGDERVAIGVAPVRVGRFVEHDWPTM